MRRVREAQSESHEVDEDRLADERARSSPTLACFGRQINFYLMTIHQTLQSIQKRLAPVSGEFALPEAERILEFLCKCSRSELYLSIKKELSHEIIQKIEALVNRRLTDEPLAYILGSVYFYNREFIVTPDVLIPRPDTEILVEEVLENEAACACRFLEMGTGAGCITAVLTEQNPFWKAVATDC